ncbi:DNA replication factor Cdt1 [Tribolium castaneum]|uniref:DNA replication factor Cdt1-like Protein n=1 Tax=Tribolium castaneum TaxID=7070 RepID=D6WGF9_TRICA|nr:PREDICTED: DNA replication factor Cdt1 [Tribolium castaneum]EFA00549.1 DNA replication factor Cdt1-like Protein [Tribolium castaneum]|eukprot:XP_969028.1 PREDICTED: DNA replication factor Cdt1 [Tribolium castaneum]
MAQPSVAQYFNNRKRAAVDDYKSEYPQKVLRLDQDATTHSPKTGASNESKIVVKPPEASKVVKCTNLEQQNVSRKVIKVPKKKLKAGSNQDIQSLLNNMRKIERCVTPPNPSEKDANKELDHIKKKICQSSKFKELKASISRFKQSAEQLKVAEKKTADVAKSPQLKTFKSIEFEVVVSPQKVQSPEKPYLSPKKEPTVRRNLLSALSPKKTLFNATDTTSKDTESLTPQGLQLPFKYKTLTELFRSIDTVSQILFNRKEVITFRKLKPAVEEMVKRNLLEKHLAQIKSVYPTAYNFRQEKLKVFGTREERWELVLTPNLTNSEDMTSQVLIDRRRVFTETLIDKVKDYHNEFLLTLTPPMIISKDKITRWHPEFDLEKVPEIELGALPEPPFEEKFTTGKQVLEKARQMFNCNTRMEQALLKLKEAQQKAPTASEGPPTQVTSVLKGIPKALLEKVRQKQAAKALVSMTRTVDKEKEVQLYARLPEIARLTRNLFVTEKKTVLELDFVIDKLGNSYRTFLNKAEMENHLKAISNAVPGWLVFHKLRSSVFLKLAKNADLSQVLSKLEKISKEKNES